MRRKGTPIGQYGLDLDFGVPLKNNIANIANIANVANVINIANIANITNIIIIYSIYCSIQFLF